ncbi:MAG: hypothetical protein IJ291_02705 [Lachnospiraceae bacterium]|nr:hypothetical protein [Lachnospiraceae bacterium]
MWISIFYMFAISLFLTILTEALVAFIWKVRSPKVFMLVVLVNVLTNPLLVLVNWTARIYFSCDYLVMLFLTEPVVFLAEALIYRSFSKIDSYAIKHPVWYGITANAVSCGLGIVISYL